MNLLANRKKLWIVVGAAFIGCALVSLGLFSARSTARSFDTPGMDMSASEAHAEMMPSMVMANSPSLAVVAVGSPLTEAGWTVTTDSAQAGFPASNMLDNNPNTMWHSAYAKQPNHTITVDMKKVSSVSRVSVLPRQDSSPNGQIGRYQIQLSFDNANWRTVNTGTWYNSTATAKRTQYADFTPQAARYVRIIAMSEAGNRGPWAALAEVNITGTEPSRTALPRAGWTVAASSSQGAPYDAHNVIDDDPKTMWHSQFDAAYPHTLTVDMQTEQSVAAVSYRPRQDASLNGTVGNFEIQTSTDGASWTARTQGTWANDASEKAVTFAPVNARYVRLIAKSEAGNRGAWASASELFVYDAPAELPRLPRLGWTATASDQAGGYPASNVLDGNGKTLWHSNYSPAVVPMPHSVTIDMKRSQPVTGLTYSPRQDRTNNGNIGQFRIEVSNDAINWEAVGAGTFHDDKSDKFMRIPTRDVRYVRLVALSEAGNRGQWANASELYLHTTPRPAAEAGSWSERIGFPIVPASSVMLQNNKVLIFAAYTDVLFTTGPGMAVTKIAIFDLATNSIVQPPDTSTDHQMFCTGLSILPDGRVYISGGSDSMAATVYNPNNNTWAKAPQLAIPRGYQTSVTLSDGNVFSLGGSWSGGMAQKNGEILSTSTLTPRKLANVLAAPAATKDPGGQYRNDNHMWLYAAANGTVFQAGPSRQMNWISTAGQGAMAPAGLRADSEDSMNGNMVPYDVDKLLTVGGATSYDDLRASSTYTQANNKAHTIDVSGGYGKAPQVESAGSMAFPRVFANSSVLPDGTVLVTGGQQHPVPFADTAASTVAELWSPATKSFKQMAPEGAPRVYHSAAILLPDARVLSVGGGLCGNCTTNHPDGQIFTPPYLLNANGTPRTRPIITSAPSSAQRGATITVKTNTASPKFALVRTSSATHAINSDQRRIPLTPSSISGDTATLTIPSKSGVVIPGYYMLFVLDQAGTPSVAKFVRIS